MYYVYGNCKVFLSALSASSTSCVLGWWRELVDLERLDHCGVILSSVGVHSVYGFRQLSVQQLQLNIEIKYPKLLKA